MDPSQIPAQAASPFLVSLLLGAISVLGLVIGALFMRLLKEIDGRRKDVRAHEIQVREQAEEYRVELDGVRGYEAKVRSLEDELREEREAKVKELERNRDEMKVVLREVVEAMKDGASEVRDLNTTIKAHVGGG